MEFLYGILGIVITVSLLVWMFITQKGNANFEVRAKEHTAFEIEEVTQDSVTLRCKVEFANVGKQCGTIMDCYVRHLLPYEQFDGVSVYSKAELESAPREDDYFEAVLIQHQSSIFVVVKVKLVARKCDDIKVALADMVDMPIDLVYQYVARKPWAIGKERIELPAAEIAKLVGINLSGK